MYWLKMHTLLARIHGSDACGMLVVMPYIGHMQFSTFMISFDTRLYEEFRPL